MKKYFSSLILLLTLIPYWVQSQDSFVENVAGHISKNIAITGETIWFSMNVHIPNTQNQSSKIAYAELVNREGQAVLQTILPLASGVAEGYLEIPAHLESDHYLLRLYTRISPILSNNGVFNKFITVINPKNPPKNFHDKEIPQNYQFKGFGDKVENKFEVKFKDDLEIEIPEKLKSKNLTVSVSVSNPFLPEKFQGHIDGRIYKKLPSDWNLIPETFGHIIAAKTLDNKVDTTETFFVSAHGKQSVVFSSKPNLEGDLYFELGAFKDYSFLIAQSSDTDKQLNFSPVSPFLPFQLNEDFAFPPLNLGPSDKAFLLDLILSSQIVSYYFPLKKPESLPIITGFLPDITYFLDDYTRFDDVETTLREYVPEVWVRKQSKNTLFKVSNTPLNDVFRENPLILLDAMPVFDADALAKFNPIKIKKLEVITREFSFNKDKFSGVISFTSYDNDFGGFELPEKALYLNYPEIQKPKQLTSPHFNADLGNRNSPDFRTSLLWIHNSNPLDKLNINISEIKGEYEILISTIEDNGEIKYAKSILRVED
jgi:hypothetical protein